MLTTLVFISILISESYTTEIKQTAPKSEKTKPNIVFIVADDLGWDDVSFHGSPQIPTPNIDTLAASGVILNNYYVSPSSFATKCEFMTGKYGTRLGVQHGVFHNKQAMGLPEKEKILPQYLKELGYQTHAIGKWGLGFYKESLLPWKRGFDTFFGALTSSSQDYFTHSAYDENYGLDLRRNEEVIHNATGYYSTEMYTEEAVKIINNVKKSDPFFLYVAHQAVHSGNTDDPLQVPPSYLKKIPNIKNEKRKLYAGMVAALDESVLNISVALSDKGLLENTIIIFTTDAGGAVGGMELNSASNYPLRGSKLTVWEGGVRGVAFVYSEMLTDAARVSEEMFHSTDWLPTILKLAGSHVKANSKLDGFDVWPAITNSREMSPRFEILHQFDPLQKNQCALRVGDYKLIINQDIGFYGDWYPRPSQVGELKNLSKPKTLPNAKIKCDKNYPHPFLEMHAPPCDPMKKPCLFNIQWDPCEFHNLAEFMPNTLKVLMDRLQFYRTAVTRPFYPKFDPKADPENNDGVWGPWTHSPSKENSTENVRPVNSVTVPTTLMFISGPPAVMLSQTQDTKLPDSYISTTKTPSAASGGLAISLKPADYLNAVFLSSKPAPVVTLEEQNITATPPPPPAWAVELGNNKTQTPSPLNNVDIYGYKINKPDDAVAYTTYSGNVMTKEKNLPVPNFDNSFSSVGQVYSNNNQTIPVNFVPTYTLSNVTAGNIINNTVNNNSEGANAASSNAENPNIGIKQSDILDIITDPNDHVSIVVANRNGSREKSHEYATITDDSVSHGEGSTQSDSDRTMIHIHIHQNESVVNPMEAIVENNEWNEKKNSSTLTTSVTDDSLAYTSTEEHGQEHKDLFTYESGPLYLPSKINGEKIESQPKPNVIQSTGINITNDDNSSIMTGEESPPAALVKPVLPSNPQRFHPVPVAQNGPETSQPKLPPSPYFESDLENPYNIEANREKNQAVVVAPKANPNPEIVLPPPVSLQKAASLRPNGKKKPVEEGNSMSLNIGSGSETSTSSESSVGSSSESGAEGNTLQAVESQSKLPALQNPLIISALKNLADAGDKGKGNTQGMSSEVALVTGSYTGKGEGKKPIASNFIKEPEYDAIIEPEFDKPKNPFAEPSERIKAGSSSSAGSTTESETVAGSFGSSEAGTKIGQKVGKKGPKLTADASQPTSTETKYNDVAKTTAGEVPYVEPVLKVNPSTFVKPEKGKLGSALKAAASHLPVDDSEFSLLNGKHNDLPNTVIAGHRPFSTVIDVVSDSSSQECGEGRDCIPHQDLQIPASVNTIAITQQSQTDAFELRTQATSNLLTKPKANETSSRNVGVEPQLNKLPPVEKLHRFFGEIKVDDSKLFYISGTASEDKSLVVPSTDSSGLITTQTDAMYKHNIGFNVLLPGTMIRQAQVSVPKFKERSKIENSTRTIKSRVGESPFVHSKSKAAIKRIFDMISDPARTRKTKVELPPVEEHVITDKSDVDTSNENLVGGEAGDIGTTKPLKDTLVASKSQTIISTLNETNVDVSSNINPSQNTESGDLGSIVTLVGKVKQDRISSKRAKHNTTEDNNARKKTVSKEHMSMKHLKHNTSETNAANIDIIQGPSNSIIVSSVIVVLVASFVVVGMAVVAIIAVVARHCRLGKHFEAS